MRKMQKIMHLFFFINKKARDMKANVRVNDIIPFDSNIEWMGWKT
jgi:hypothetical protein